MAEQDEQPTRFAPVVLAGFASAAVLTVTAARNWFELGGNKMGVGVPSSELRADMPLALALALIVLAAWGVVLVTGPRARRLVLALAGVADLGIVACVVAAPMTLPDQIRTDLAVDGGLRGEPTTAYLVAAVVVVLALAPIVAGWRLAPLWPEMSSRYDAPTAAATASDPDAPTDDLSLWKALDEGRDPTAPGSP